MWKGRGEWTYQVDVSVAHPSHFTRYSNILEVPSPLLPTALRLCVSSNSDYDLGQGVGVSSEYEVHIPDVLLHVKLFGITFLHYNLLLLPTCQLDSHTPSQQERCT